MSTRPALLVVARLMTALAMTGCGAAGGVGSGGAGGNGGSGGAAGGSANAGAVGTAGAAGGTGGAADFVSLDLTPATSPRAADGGLPRLDLFRLKPGSALIDAGANVGLPYLGTAPDLGAFEFQP
jgi:hypothetical protein